MSMWRRLDQRLRERGVLPEVPAWAVNVGGGPRFAARGWLNLDAVDSPGGQSFILSPSSAFPVADGAVSLVYTSHTLEHLDDATVDQVLKESFRITKPGDHLLVKLPDFDRALAAWRSRDASFFTDTWWNYQSVRYTWAHREVEDSLDTRASMIFCGWWNTAYGDHFARRTRRVPDAYHGPAIVDATWLREVVQHATPHELSQRLYDQVRHQESGYIFNHQNAWSREELRALLAKHRWRVVTDDAERIQQEWRHVPTINELAEQSMYVVAQRY